MGDVMDQNRYKAEHCDKFDQKTLHKQLDAIIDSSFDAIWLFDKNSRVIRINRTAEKINDIKAKDVLNRTACELLSTGWFDRSASIEAIKTRKTVTIIQQLKNGRQVLVTATPVLDDEGEIITVVVNGRDMTEITSLQSALKESRALSQEYRAELSNLFKEKKYRSNLVIRCESMRRILSTALRIATVDSTILIKGDSGVGKGLFAKLIHQNSKYCSGPLISVDCGAIPEQLLESELFGYDEGAFTGARSGGKPGLFEMADGGTLFLDEVSELPLNIQVKLLRFIEENVVVHVGGTTPKKIDTRIIAATNRDIEVMAEQGLFRNDLFFRLNVIPLYIPPLSERAEEIPIFIHFFLKKFNKKVKMNKVISPMAMDCIARYPFPGNIRELANLIEQLVVMVPGERIDVEDLPSHIQAKDKRKIPFLEQKEWDLKKVLVNSEKETIRKALITFGSQRRAAGPLGIDRSTLSRKVKRYGISSQMKTRQVS
jgi:PAS domain S-box-containing protein